MSCNSSDPPSYCSKASPELKLYQTFILSVPILFTFILLLLFYLFYLRRRRANWWSLRMRAGRMEIPRASESGIKKEIREMLPVVVFKESFMIRETQCAVCLGDYKSDDRLQKIPPCGHTFHIECIDLWLSTNTTCPLCRVSLLPTTKTTSRSSNTGEGEASLGGQMQQESSVSPSNNQINLDRCDHATEGSGMCPRQDENRQGNEMSVVIKIEPSSAAEGSSSRP